MVTPNNFPSFTIVINTYNRAEGLRQTLRALLQLDYPNFEIVVVNGPSTDHTVQVLMEFAGRAKVFDCPVRNLSVSRNIGIAAAAAEYVAFIDDDALPEPEWLRQLAAGYVNDRVGATGGKVFDHTGYNFQYQYSTADRLGNAQWQLTEPTPELNYPGSARFPYLQGTNTSFRRSALIEIGGFDEEFEFYLDETDVCLRMGDAGYIVHQLPNAYVHHKFMPSHIRDENKITKYRYPVVKNKAYFALKNGRETTSLKDIILDTLRFAVSHLEDVDFHINRGGLPESSRQTFAEEIEKALEDGLLRGLTPGRKLITQETLSKYSRAFMPALTMDEVARLAERKTIVLVSRDYPPGHAGGIATFNKDLAVALASQGNNVHVISESHDINRVDFEEGVWVHRLIMRQVTLPEAAQKRAVPPHIWYWSAIALEETRRIAAHHKVDVVETPIWDCQGAAFLLQGEWPLVVSLQTSLLFWLESHPELSADHQWMSSFGTPMLRLERELLLGTDAARSISAAIRRDIEQAYGITFAKGQAVVAHLGMVDVSSHANSAKYDELTILFVGRLEHRKGIDVLLNAVPMVLEKTSKVLFRIIGDDTIPGPTGLTFRQQFERSEAGKRFGGFVRFEGKTDDATLVQAYADSDIFISPSRYESFGLIFLEAMRAGKPVIGCQAGGMPEIIEHEGNGLLVPPGDAVALSQAIIRLSTSPELRAQWGKRGREIFETRFTAERMAINSKAVYEAALVRHNQNNTVVAAIERPPQPHSQTRISFITGICIENDAISNAVFDEMEALRSNGFDNIRLYTYQCTQKGLPYRHVESLAEIALDPHFQESELVIFHFGVYYPLFNLLPLVPKTAKKLVIFHNITPKEFVSTDLHETIDKSFTQLSNILWADHVVCDSDTNLKVLRDAGIFTPASVLPLSASVSTHPPAYKPSFDDHIVRIVFIGRFARSKGPHELIEAVRKILSTSLAAQIELNLIGNLVISDGTLVEQLRHDLAELEQNFSGRIVAKLHGNASNVQKEELLRRADLFVLPTRHEGFCIPILEAFACGCRVITYENSNTPAISGGLSTLVPTGDVALLAQAILNDIQLVFSEQWREPGTEGYAAYTARTSEYVAQYSPEITKARFVRFIIEWLGNGQIAREFLSDSSSDNPKLHVKNVPIVSASYLLDRPKLVEKLTSKILLGESEPCLGEGWLSPENWPPRLRHFGKRARFFLKLPPGNHPILEIKAFCSNNNMSHDPVTLTVSLWGQPIGSYVFTHDGWTTVSISLPEDKGHPFLNLELSVDKTWMPDMFNHDGDTRELGLAVQTIAITTTKIEKTEIKHEIEHHTTVSKRQKKIVFWQPDSQSTYGMKLGVYPPVSLLILASIAREKGFEVAFVDSENERLSLDDTLRVLTTHKPDILAFTMPTPYVRIYNKQLPLLRRELPNTLFITGGPHPSARKEQIFIDVPHIDAAVYGEGEIAFSKLLDHILGEIPVHQIPSLIYRGADGMVSLTDQAPPIMDLDTIPFPAYDLVQHLIGIYPATFPSRTKPSIHIMATRGCPFHCTYCSNAVFGASVRMRSPEHVVREVEYLVDQLGVRELFFQDDTLNCLPEYFFKLCELIIEKNLNNKAMFKVVFRANQNLVTPELLAKAKEAGVWMIFYGVESGDPKMLQRIKKGISLDELKRAFLLTRQAGIKTHASLMIGNPGEDKESIEQSYDLLTELLPDTFCFSIAYPFPGTQFYDEAIEQGLMYPHTDFVDKHYPWIGISRTEALSREEIYHEKETIQQKSLDYFKSEEGLRRIHNQYTAAGREDLWEENLYFHENPVLWVDYDILSAGTILSYDFLQERLATHVLPGKSDYGLGEGWLTAENWPPNLRHFRKRARMFLQKPAYSSAVLTIKAFSGYLNIQNDPIIFTISVWGKPVHREIFSKHEWTTITVELSMAKIEKPFVSLEFSVNKTWCPDVFLNDGDCRQLGLAVSTVSIEPARKPS